MNKQSNDKKKEIVTNVKRAFKGLKPRYKHLMMPKAKTYRMNNK